MTVLERLRAYVAHADPATQTANLVAMVVGWNGPFYPIYMVALVGWKIALPSLLTTFAAPFFLTVPLLSRQSSSLGRLALPVVGSANTFWCLKLLGHETAVELFFLPCIVLATLLFRNGERWLFWSAATLPVALYMVPQQWIGQPVIVLSAAEASRLAALNEGSVFTLMVFIAVQFASLLRDLETCAAVAPPGQPDRVGAPAATQEFQPDVGRSLGKRAESAELRAV
jgi:hypothetical protein